MNIQQAGEASGLTPDTIRFYERKGAVPAPPRRPNGYRHYTEKHVDTLRLARGLRQLGVPLDRIAPILGVAHDGTCRQVRETMVESFSEVLHDLDRQLADLSSVRQQLATLLDGLRRMRPSGKRVPGVEACACVRLVRKA